MEVYDEVDLIRIEEFLAVTKKFETHHKNYPDVKNHCDTCRWVEPRLERLRKKTMDYAKMRKTDDDNIDWNLLILELLNEEGEGEEINQPSPKKPKLAEGPKAEEMGTKVQKLVDEKKAKEEADDYYNFEMDSYDDDDQEESGEDQSGEDQEDEEEGDDNDHIEGTSEQVEQQSEESEESEESKKDSKKEESKTEQENAPKGFK